MGVKPIKVLSIATFLLALAHLAWLAQYDEVRVIDLSAFINVMVCLAEVRRVSQRTERPEKTYPIGSFAMLTFGLYYWGQVFGSREILNALTVALAVFSSVCALVVIQRHRRSE